MRTGMRNFVHVQLVGIAGAVAALVVPAHDLRDLRPGELHAVHDLVADHGVIHHFPELARLQRRRLAEKSLVDGDLADIVQIAAARSAATS